MSTHLESQIEWNLVLETVRRVPHYSGQVSIEKQWINPALSRPICLFVRTYRLSEVKQLVASYAEYQIPLFESAWLSKDDAPRRMLLPPILEVHQDQCVVIDGHHRIYEAIQQHQSAILVLIIKGQLDKLPADVLSWDEVAITNQRLPRELKFRNFRSSNFRLINELIDSFH